MSTGSTPPRVDPGLCGRCRHCKRIESARDSVFFLCQRAASDPRYRKYPPLPVHACDGFDEQDTAVAGPDH